MKKNKRLCAVLPGWAATFDPFRKHIIGVLVGEGVGSEIIPVALSLLDQLALHTCRRFEIRQGGLIGRQALIYHGKALTEEVIEFCESVFRDGGVILCGPGEDRFVYELRSHFNLFCKFTPLQPLAALKDTGVLKSEHLAGIDIVAVREIASGLYFGEWGQYQTASGITAFHHFVYQEWEVSRILKIALELARSRRGKLCVTIKRGGVPAISTLWEEQIRRLNQNADVEVDILEIDNAAYQLIVNPRKFDVMVSPNMFGDVLADCGALLLGSRGVSFSGNFGTGGLAVFQTGHGAAHDIAGTDIANPVGQIYSMAMMLRESFAWMEGAAAIETAVENTLAHGYRTPDIAIPNSHVVGTRELGCYISESLADYLDGITI